MLVRKRHLIARSHPPAPHALECQFRSRRRRFQNRIKILRRSLPPDIHHPILHSAPHVQVQHRHDLLQRHRRMVYKIIRPHQSLFLSRKRNKQNRPRWRRGLPHPRRQLDQRRGSRCIVIRSVINAPCLPKLKPRSPSPQMIVMCPHHHNLIRVRPGAGQARYDVANMHHRPINRHRPTHPCRKRHRMWLKRRINPIPQRLKPRRAAICQQALRRLPRDLHRRDPARLPRRHGRKWHQSIRFLRRRIHDHQPHCSMFLRCFDLRYERCTLCTPQIMRRLAQSASARVINPLLPPR